MSDIPNTKNLNDFRIDETCYFCGIFLSTIVKRLKSQVRICEDLGLAKAKLRFTLDLGLAERKPNH